MGYYHGGGLANGFAQGFGLVDDYQRKNRQEERQKEYDARASELHGVQMRNYGNQQEAYEYDKARRPALEKQADAEHTAKMNQWAASTEWQQMQTRNAGIAQTRKESLDIIDQVMANKGQFTPELLTLAERNSNKEGSLLAAWGGDFDLAFQDNDTINAAFSGRTDPREALPSFARWLKPEVAKVVGQTDQQTGQKIVDADLVDAQFVEDGKGVNLYVNVKYEDGSSQTKPVTEFRLAGAGEPLKTVYLEDLWNKHMAERTVLGMLRAQPGFDNMRTGLSKLYAQNHPGKNQIPAQHQTGLEIFKQMQKDLAKVSQPGQFGEPVSQEAVRAAQRRIDEYVRANPWITNYVNTALPPTMDQLIQLANNRTWLDKNGRTGAEAKQRYLQKLTGGEMDLRLAYEGLLASTTEQAPNPPKPAGDKEKEGLLSWLFNDQKPEQAPVPAPKPVGIKQQTVSTRPSANHRPTPPYKETATAIQDSIANSNVRRVNKDSDTTPRYGYGIPQNRDKDQLARK